MRTAITRRIASAMLAAGVLALAAPAAMAATTMNLGWATPLDADNGVFAKKFKELVEEKTGGEVEVKLRPSGQIGSEDDAFKALQLGTIDGYLITSNNISPHFGTFDIFVLPYIFESPEHTIAVLDGEIGQSLKDEIYDKTGVHLLSFNNVSYRDLFNTVRPIEKFEDIAGLKYRVPKNEVMIETYRAFGAEPVPLAWSETPTALQTGTIDGGDNGTSTIRDMKFYEFAKNLAVLEHFATFTPLLVSDRFMSKLTAEQADLVREAAKEAQAHQREVLSAQTEDVRAELEAQGMAITRPDKAPFIEAARTVQDKIAAEKGDEFSAYVDKIRAAGS